MDYQQLNLIFEALNRLSVQLEFITDLLEKIERNQPNPLDTPE